MPANRSALHMNNRWDDKIIIPVHGVSPFQLSASDIKTTYSVVFMISHNAAEETWQGFGAYGVLS